MPIDWFTVAAQAVNFLILLALLRRFLYRPVLEAMDRREARIAERLQEAAEHREVARREQERLAAERAELEGSRTELLQSAREEGEHLRREAIAAARLEAERRSEAWRAELHRQEEQLVADLVAAMAERVRHGLADGLEQLAGADLRTAAIQRLLQRLESMGGADREELAAVLRGRDVEVRLAAAPPDAARERLLMVLTGLGADRDAVKVTIDPALIAGGQIRAGGRRIDWSLARFSDEAADDLRRQLTQVAMPEPADAVDTHAEDAHAEDAHAEDADAA